MQYSYRKGKSGGLVHTKKWLEKWYGKPFDLYLEEIEINCEAYLAGNHKTITKLISNEKGSQSKYHIFLKAISQVWLRKSGYYHHEIKNEARCFIPARIESNHFGNEPPERLQPKPYILPKNNRAPLDMGDLIIIDIYAGNITIEVGFTTPFNLLIPLLKGLVETAVWVPYCDPYCTKSFDLADPRLTRLPAYKISMS